MLTLIIVPQTIKKKKRITLLIEINLSIFNVNKILIYKGKQIINFGTKYLTFVQVVLYVVDFK